MDFRVEVDLSGTLICRCRKTRHRVSDCRFTNVQYCESRARTRWVAIPIIRFQPFWFRSLSSLFGIGIFHVRGSAVVSPAFSVTCNTCPSNLDIRSSPTPPHQHSTMSYSATTHPSLNKILSVVKQAVAQGNHLGRASIVHQQACTTSKI